MAEKRNIIERINYMAGYVINETPKYRPVIDSSSFDSIPNMGEADTAPEAELKITAPVQPAQQDKPEASGSAAPQGSAPEDIIDNPTGAAPSPAPAASPTPATPGTTPEPMPAIDPPGLGTPPAQTAASAPAQPSTDQLQADVMRFQLDAMKKMAQQIDQLESMVAGLNNQNAELHKEVEKVREPSDIEKFSNRKQDSSPYYFNLNDMWNGNTFQARMDNYNSKGIIKTKDGYIADFDSLPKLNAYQVKDSFEQV